MGSAVDQAFGKCFEYFYTVSTIKKAHLYGANLANHLDPDVLKVKYEHKYWQDWNLNWIETYQVSVSEILASVKSMEVSTMS